MIQEIEVTLILGVDAKLSRTRIKKLIRENLPFEVVKVSLLREEAEIYETENKKT